MKRIDLDVEEVLDGAPVRGPVFKGDSDDTEEGGERLTEARNEDEIWKLPEIMSLMPGSQSSSVSSLLCPPLIKSVEQRRWLT
jgi:hypothetical protein